jgi:nickel-dependent lactate racemase
MRVEFDVDGRTIAANLDIPDDRIVIAQSRDPPPPAAWEDIVLDALANPIGAPRLRDHDLAGRKVVVITDDWGRPTPAWRVLPAILADVEAAGAARDDITIITGSGVHLPMSDEDVIRKVGQEVFDSYRCISHDAVEHEMTFIGQSSRGTPVWVSRIVAEADFRIAVGRVGPHPTHGYEGGAKMITPAVSHWLTVLRNHSTNFSPYAEYGSLQHNPSRLDVDEIGGMAGLEYIVNFVVNRRGECFAGFAGHRLRAHRAAIAWGDCEVWGAEFGKRADIAIAAPGDCSRQTMAASPLDMAILACRPGGTTILVNGEGPAANPLTPRPAFANGSTPTTLADQMASWRFDQIFQEHERRDNDLEPRKISDRCKTIRGEYYRRRPGMTRHVIVVGEPLAPDAEWRANQHLAETLQQAIDQAIAREGKDASVVIVPHASTTLPLERFHQPDDALDVGGEDLVHTAAR